MNGHTIKQAYAVFDEHIPGVARPDDTTWPDTQAWHDLQTDAGFDEDAFIQRLGWAMVLHPPQGVTIDRVAVGHHALTALTRVGDDVVVNVFGISDHDAVALRSLWAGQMTVRNHIPLRRISLTRGGVPSAYTERMKAFMRKPVMV